jgi:hypothetical protein
MPPLIIIDAANVVGSVPDGWWRDRAGATKRLRDRLAPLSEHGLPAWPTEQPPEILLVVEGAARAVTSVPGVRVIAAPRSGDDTIVDLVAAREHSRPCLVITADRELRRRVTTLGADTLGPRTVR